jgi:tRNA(Ile)-lysidine synthetase-like protein
MMLDAAVPGRRITRDLIGALRRLITEPPPASLDLPNAIRAWRSDTMLHVGMPPVCDAPEWSMQPVQFDRNTLQRFLRTKSDDEEFIDGDTLSGTLTLRRAHLGERFHPLGAPGTKTVGDFLTDQKVPTYQRPAWVLADDVGIVWLIGRRIDHRVRITDATRRIARLAAHART